MAVKTQYFIDPKCITESEDMYRFNELATYTYVDNQTCEENCVVIFGKASICQAEQSGGIVSRNLSDIVNAINSAVFVLLSERKITVVNRDERALSQLTSFCNRVQNLVDKENQNIDQSMVRKGVDIAMRLVSLGTSRLTVPSVHIPRDDRIREIIRETQ